MEMKKITKLLITAASVIALTGCGNNATIKEKRTIVLDIDSDVTGQYLREHLLIKEDPAVKADIDMFKKGGEFEGMFPERWLPSCFAVLAEPFTEQNQMINSTMKMVRGKIEKAYADRIAFMYTAEGKQLLNQQNLDALK